MAIIENFFNEEEVNEMLEAGKQLCHDAPKEERVLFSAQVRLDNDLSKST